MRKTHTPAEWHQHEAVWLAWPSHPAEWLGDVESPRRSIAELCAAIASPPSEPDTPDWRAPDPDTSGCSPGQRTSPSPLPAERIELLVLDQAGETSARQALGAIPVRYHYIPFGDIWLRDTGPVFIQVLGHSEPGRPEPFQQAPAGACRELRAACFQWNGWGEKYRFEHDSEVCERIAEAAATPVDRHAWILEGGAIEIDGQGTALTTQQCLLNANRNPDLNRADVEQRLSQSLGIERVLWLERGLANDHTDGHIDNLARFVAPGRVVCMRSVDSRDPNRAVLDDIARTLRGFRDARGRKLEVVELPSPGPIYHPNGDIAPASYANFYIGNRAVIVPTYGAPGDRQAVDTIAQMFPKRQVHGIDARAILVGGGAFHCITRQQPVQWANTEQIEL
ncbi:MAG: agmatine deiminase family protein [Proteobacteria bacterium]|nr:agmatine deiminase family protein [Pseudomonadota bacterium]